jgi:hypothetical protein
MCNEGKNQKSLGFWEKHLGKASRIVKYEKALTIFILIAGMVVAIIAAYLGSSTQAQLAYENDLKIRALEQHNFANMVYFDIINLNWTLSRSYYDIINAPSNGTIGLIVVGDLYPTNGLYYSFRPEIATFKSSLAYNITVYYTNLIYADEYSKAWIIANEKNNNVARQYALDQYLGAIKDAYKIQPFVLNELKNEYNITENYQSRFQSF